MRSFSVLGMACGLCACLLSVATTASSAASGDPPWLTAVNQYRAEAGLAPVVEDPALSAKDQLHAEYMADTQTMEHAEDPSDPHYSADGDYAAQHSNLAAGYWTTSADAVDDWMHAPFHAIGVLDPTLTAMGYGQALSSNGLIYSALDVLSDTNAQATPSWPVVWPGTSSHPHILAYTGEYPDVATGCPADYETGTPDAVGGRDAVDGLPFLVQLGPGAPAPTDVSATVSSDGATLTSCVVDENTYTNTNSGSQQVGRELLGESHSIVVIPRQPLKPVTTYTFHVVVGSTDVTRTFTTDRGHTTIDLQTLSKPRFDGEDVFVGGYVDNDFGPLAGQTVQVLTGAAGAQRVVATVKTGKDGSWETTVRPEGRTTYVARFPGSTSYYPSTSSPATMITEPGTTALHVDVLPSHAARGSKVTVYGLLYNPVTHDYLAHQPVTLWARTAGQAWREITTARTSSGGSVVIAYALRATAVLQLRYAGTTTYPRYRPAVSRTVTVRSTA